MRTEIEVHPHLLDSISYCLTNRVQFILLDFLDRLKGETAIAVSPFYVGGRENDNFYNILAHAHPDSSRISS